MKSFAEPSAQPNSESDPFSSLPPDDARRSALDRVLSSSVFQRSPRSRELLRYLCKQALLRPTGGISEQDIATEVYGRRPGYNASEDSIARVQVSQLRKKLHLYSVDEGLDDPTIIEIPAGSYTPIFRAREIAAESTPEPVPAPVPVNKTRRWSFLLIAATALLAVFSGWLLYQNLSLERELHTKFPPSPNLDRLWTSIFQQDRPLQVVLSDSSLMQVADLTNKSVNLQDYLDSFFPSTFLSKNVTDPQTLNFARQLASHVYTTTQDTYGVWQFSRLTLRYGIPASIISAREFRLAPQTKGDVILLGHPSSDPWMEVFEDRMNFRFDSTPDGKRSIINVKPLPGEASAYTLDPYPAKIGYCVIAFQPKPVGTGNALLILGTNMASTEAGLLAISDNTFAGELLRRIEAKSSGPLPYFEVLVRVKLLQSVAPGFEFVAQRTSAR